MNKNKIAKFISDLKNIIKSGNSIAEYERENNLSKGWFYRKKQSAINAFEKKKMDKKSFEKIMELCNQCTEIRKLSKAGEVNDANFESRSKGEIVRDQISSLIEKYTFDIQIRDKQNLQGSFTRDEMNLIYRLYSSYGSSITQREVSRFFPEFSLVDFKRILRAFNITKASAPFAPHVIEETPSDQLLEIQYREKENDFLKSYEAEKIKQTELKLKQCLKENADLKNKFSSAKELIGYEGGPISFKTYPKSSKTGASLVIYLSDIHVGAYNNNEGVYNNEYSEEVIQGRLQKILDEFSNEVFTDITVMNLGDSLDSYKRETTRGGHELPTLLTDKEQSKLYLKLMQAFFRTLKAQHENSNLNYVCVAESNHDGTWGWINNIVLANYLETIEINAYVANKSIENIKIQNTHIVYMHGKDNDNQYKGFPLTLNDKTENYFNEYLDRNRIPAGEQVIVVKGDQHQSAITRGKRFTYHSVASLYGSSNWITANFGFTPWGCDYSIISGTKIINGLIQ